MGKVTRSFPSIRYYDARPPAPLLLEHLWTDVFPSLVEDGEYDQSKRVFRIPVSIVKVTREIQKAYGSGLLRKDKRSSEFPQQKWLRNAFDFLVEQKLANPPADGDTYVILFRAFRGDVLKRFVDLFVSSSKKKGTSI